MYFPVGLALSPGGHTLYVVNSDFDLQFNGGTVLALDLDRIRSNVGDLRASLDGNEPCKGVGPNNTTVLYPGPCGPIDLRDPPDGQGSLVRDSVEIGAFATDIIAVARKDAPGARLFVPIQIGRAHV